MPLSERARRAVVAVLFLFAGLTILAILGVWGRHAPEVVATGTPDRFFAPAMTVSASLMIAVSVTGATVMSRFDSKRLLGELAMFFFAVVSLLIGLFMGTWGLVSGTMDNGLVLGLIVAIPVTWGLGSLLLLGAMVAPFIYKRAD